MKLYGLIGYPLSHSFSGKYFSEKFRNEGIVNCDYNLYPLPDIDRLITLISSNPGLLGLNVTIPFKREVIQYLDAMDEDAQKIGAVNTIKIFRAGKKIFLKGYNTDAYGFITSLLPHLKENLPKTAMILGTGGASMAVQYILEKLGFDIVNVSRSPRRMGQISYAMVDQALMANSGVIVNASPVGMYPDVNDSPDIPYELISKKHILFDLIYNPPETQFMARGRQRGATVINGLEMLHLQAEKSWEIWNSENYSMAPPADNS